LADIIVSRNPVINFLIEKKYFYIRHFLLFIVLCLAYNLFSPSGIALYAEKVNVPYEVFYIGQMIDMLVSMMLIYLNLYYLFPRYFKKGLYTEYAIGVIVIAILFFIIGYSIQNIYVTHYGKKESYAVKLTLEDFIGLVMFPIVFLSATTGYKVFKEWINDQERYAALEKEKLSTELSQLKGQVNPHFLFNTLNNLNVLIQTDAQKASDIVLGLSDVLRYQIYDSQNEKILLNKDIEIIEQYLQLEKIRRDNLTINVSLRSKINNVFVPPLLFTNFIDNAIKHSQSRDPSYINLSFEVVDKNLIFEIINSKPTTNIIVEKNGLGLDNIKKRLNLLYGEAHKLEIRDEKIMYRVKLKIPV
jgi:sensor histidine kinase YesM